LGVVLDATKIAADAAKAAKIAHLARLGGAFTTSFSSAADLTKLVADKAAGADNITLAVDALNISVDGASQTGGVYGEIGGTAFTIYDWIFDVDGQAHDAGVYPGQVGQAFDLMQCGCAAGGGGPISGPH
jgi:hypothetical protein